MTTPLRRLTAAALAALLAGASLAPQAFAQGAQAPAAAPAADGPKTPLPAPTPRAAQPGGDRRAAADPDWPCIQPKVGALGYGQMWSGPPLEQALETWRQDEAVADLVPVIVARRTKPEEAAAAIDKFAKDAGAEKNAKLTLLFAGAFEELNTTRSAILAGIERYARKQRALSEKIKQESLKLASERKDMATQNSPEFQQKEQARDWDTRIYDERSQALTYVCESPVILEQLAFTLGREIQARMD
ncbi:hypothetical protein [Methylopila sp. Yamaguchi]|uniref:hypothetical protein n=1 Tax=Methylopila sp. Yamaguchi TaxID=1437817 RepID=UPI000CC08D9E|nr:hypothetical protein [Methylopila sp. Yamaguchi]GBD48587.1 hypothetical protein METY_1800 [Methylopila sp. Yamaguchi]